MFETDYEKINLAKIKNLKQTRAGISFVDDKHEYSYNKSKSTLFRRFVKPKNAHKIDISILKDPYDLLLHQLQSNQHQTLLTPTSYKPCKDFVILPLYSTRNINPKTIPTKSALNQWNSGGRVRDIGEVYIPVPRNIHRVCPNFFPSKDTSFNLYTPNNSVFQAKVCQQNDKALMTNPNRALAEWLLIQVATYFNFLILIPNRTLINADWTD